MPCDFTIRTDIEAVVTRFWATVTDDEFIELYRALLGSPRYRPGLMELADLRSVDRFSVSATALRLVDWMMRQRVGSEDNARTLVISPEDERFGLARMYLSFAEPSVEEVEVCRTLEEAAASAGLSAPVLEQVFTNPMGQDSAPSRPRSRPPSPPDHGPRGVARTWSDDKHAQLKNGRSSDPGPNPR